MLEQENAFKSIYYNQRARLFLFHFLQPKALIYLLNLNLYYMSERRMYLRVEEAWTFMLLT